MSESRTNLEQILELLLAEENEKAEEMLHEYVVAKARAEYERVLDESEEEEVEEEVEESFDAYESEEDLYNDEEEIEDDEIGEGEDEDEEPVDMTNDFEDDIADDEGYMGDEEDEELEDEGDEDLEDKVEDLEAELEDLRAEFEALMADEAGEEEHADMDFGGDEMDMGDEGEEEMMDSYEYDLDEAEEVDEEEELEEATQFSKKTAEQPMKGAKLKGSDDDNSQSPYTNAPKPSTVGKPGQPVKANNGGEGKKNHGGTVKDHTPTNNLNVDPAKAKRPADGNYQ